MGFTPLSVVRGVFHTRVYVATKSGFVATRIRLTLCGADVVTECLELALPSPRHKATQATSSKVQGGGLVRLGEDRMSGLPSCLPSWGNFTQIACVQPFGRGAPKPSSTMCAVGCLPSRGNFTKKSPYFQLIVNCIKRHVWEARHE